MYRTAVLLYGVVGYFLGLVGFVLLILLLNGWGLRNMVAVREDTDVWPWLVNIVLLLLFGLVHSVMAHERFKARLALSPALERSSYVLIAGASLALLALVWQPLPGVLWRLPPDSVAAWGLNGISALGWLVVFASTCMISHTDLFGLRQSWLQWRERQYTDLPFHVRGFYRLTRHPMMTGMLLAFWFTPEMTAGRLLFNSGMTLYILVGVYFEERSLLKALGADYQRYCRHVPMLLPRMGIRNKPTE